MPPRPRLLQHPQCEPLVGPTLRVVCNLNRFFCAPPAISGCDGSGAPPMLVSPQGSTLRPAWRVQAVALRSGGAYGGRVGACRLGREAGGDIREGPGPGDRAAGGRDRARRPLLAALHEGGPRAS